MEINSLQIQKLRGMTGAGVMDCKKALTEAQGDIDRAREIIKERGLAKVEKRAGRETGAGLVASYVHNDRIGAMVDLRAETDFVVRSEPFRNLARELAMQLAAVSAESVEEFLGQPHIKNESRKVSDIINDVIAQVGENVKVNAISRLEI